MTTNARSVPNYSTYSTSRLRSHLQKALAVSSVVLVAVLTGSMYAALTFSIVLGAFYFIWAQVIANRAPRPHGRRYRYDEGAAAATIGVAASSMYTHDSSCHGGGFDSGGDCGGGF
ncbi:MAG: hypothetical protein HY329_19425 [Chloroflexi bacterium]|nr:hypothetical protein [Chloroflexota bacterium]